MVMRKINIQFAKMVAVLAILVGIGLYALDFVIAGLMAKLALNLSIFVTFGFCYLMTLRVVWMLRNDVRAIEALRADFAAAAREGSAADVLGRPAIVFGRPVLLQQAYRQIAEQFEQSSRLHIPNATAQEILKSIDHEIAERRSLMGYFGGLQVFLGLFGAFIGLMHTVQSVSELLSAMNAAPTAAGGDSFGALIDGLKAPLSGMSVGFSSSLFGLSTSIAIGVIDRLMADGMAAVRHDLEEYLAEYSSLERAGAIPMGGGAVVSFDPGTQQALATATLQIADMQMKLAEFAAAGAEGRATLTAIHAKLDEIGADIRSVVDPAPFLLPISAALADLANRQSELATYVVRLDRLSRRQQVALNRAAERYMLTSDVIAEFAETIDRSVGDLRTTSRQTAAAMHRFTDEAQSVTTALGNAESRLRRIARRARTKRWRDGFGSRIADALARAFAPVPPPAPATPQGALRIDMLDEIVRDQAKHTQQIRELIANLDHVSRGRE
ncbi:MAG: hypothetical protein INF91_01600 [Alphaproteobacteria bacterium]|nr:hypothetical protein [Alphaproteobacteria bacterium]